MVLLHCLLLRKEITPGIDVCLIPFCTYLCVFLSALLVAFFYISDRLILKFLIDLKYPHRCS